MIALKGGDLAVLRVLRDAQPVPAKVLARYLKNPDSVSGPIAAGLVSYDRVAGKYSITIAGRARLLATEPATPEVLPPPNLGGALQYLANGRALTAPWAEAAQFFGVADTRRKATLLGKYALALYAQHGVAAVAIAWLRALARAGGTTSAASLGPSMGVTAVAASQAMGWLSMTQLVQVAWGRDSVRLEPRGIALLDQVGGLVPAASELADTTEWFA